MDDERGREGRYLSPAKVVKVRVGPRRGDEEGRRAVVWPRDDDDGSAVLLLREEEAKVRRLPDP